MVSECHFFRRYLSFVFSGPNFINVVSVIQFSLMLLNSSCKDTRQTSAEKFEFYSSRHTEFTSTVQKWLNHEWKETFDVDLDPFDKTTFPCTVPLVEFILTSNDSLISINC